MLTCRFAKEICKQFTHLQPPLVVGTHLIWIWGVITLIAILILKAFTWVNIKRITVFYYPDSALRKIQHCMRKILTVGHVHKIFELLKVAKTNNLLTRNALNQLKHHHTRTIWKNSRSRAQYSTRQISCLHPRAIFFLAAVI